MEVRKIGVVGSGQMAVGVAQIAAASNYAVILRARRQEACDKSIDKIKSGLDKRVAQGKETQENVDRIIGNISTTVEMQDLKNCDLVIEAIAEDLELKKATFAELSGICRSDAILCTNSSSLSITSVMADCVNQERCAGMHFFFPVTAMRLVEIIKGDKTSDATVETIKEAAVGMGKTSVLVKRDTPGFIVNRCLFAFMLEAISCYRDGVATAEDIDTAVKLGLNHPLGPFEMMDLSGLDTFPHVCESLSSLPITDWSTPDAVKELIKAGKFGRKSGSGWYEY